jgi:hypothetical protein
MNDPLLDFLKFAAKTEFTTPGGQENFLGMAILGLLVAGQDWGDIFKQGMEFLGRITDRILHFFEKILEFFASVLRTSFKATPLGAGYSAPTGKAPERSRGLVLVGAFVLLCALAVGGAGYGRYVSKHAEGSVQDRASLKCAGHDCSYATLSSLFSQNLAL